MRRQCTFSIPFSRFFRHILGHFYATFNWDYYISIYKSILWLKGQRQYLSIYTVCFEMHVQLCISSTISVSHYLAIYFLITSLTSLISLYPCVGKTFHVYLSASKETGFDHRIVCYLLLLIFSLRAISASWYLNSTV